nr:MAG TPA: Ribosomal L40e family [Caudoviricetes sp.]DAI19912.1 MAG TPA: Ribosomal L40e family [Caudoviricetes sp.]
MLLEIADKHGKRICRRCRISWYTNYSKRTVF